MFKDYDVLKQVEGLRLRPYKDSLGNLTIGYGRNLSNGISEFEANVLFQFDIMNSLKDLYSIFDDFYNYPFQVRLVLVSMMFNLGKNKFLTFKKFICAIKNKDYKKAIEEAYNSKRFHQVPNRVEFEVNLLKDLLKEIK
jgi:lysozyme